MFKRYTAILLTVLTSLASGVAVNAGGPQEKFDQDAISKIKEEGIKHSQVMDTLSYLRCPRPAVDGLAWHSRRPGVGETEACLVGFAEPAPRGLGPVRSRVVAGRVFSKHDQTQLHSADRIPQGLVAQHQRCRSRSACVLQRKVRSRSRQLLRQTQRRNSAAV